MSKFKGLRAAAVLGAAALFVGIPLASQAADSGKARVIVTFKQGAEAGTRKAIANAGGRVRVELGEVRAIAIEVPRAAVALLKRSAHVEAVEEDADQHMFAASTPSGPPYELGQQVPYGIPMVQADQVPDTNAGNRKICIIDSGIDRVHEDLNGIPVAGENLTTSGTWDTDEAQHGTHVAGTMVAINQPNVGVVGVAPNKNLNVYVVKVFDASGSASSSTITKAMLRCRANGANVVSMSLGGSTKSPVQEKVANFLAAKNILVIAAAGNAGTTAISYPAGYASVVSVAALDENKAWATFSQFNADVEIAAPGVGVLSTVPMGTGSDASLAVGASTYPVIGMLGSPLLSRTGPLADFGIGDAPVPGSMAGKVCLIQRGTISFSDKVLNCQNSGGIGAVIYNNVPGPLNGTLNGVVTTIPSVGATDTDGAAMLGQLGQSATVAVTASNYALFNGTSMATPHASSVAALVWSYHTNCTAAQIRTSLNLSAQDLGDPGRDDKFGNGLVQAKAAHDRISTLGCGM